MTGAPIEYATGVSRHQDTRKNNDGYSKRRASLKMVCWLWVCLFSANLSAQSISRDSVYQFRTGRVIGLLGTGLALNGVAELLNRQAVPFTDIQINEFNASDVNRFDRGATRNWSPRADRISDLTLIGTAGVVGLTGLPLLRQKTWYMLPLMYAETMLLTMGLQDMVKVTVSRTRPFVYNSEAPQGVKLDKDARRSFYSGHSAMSFGSAVFASTVFGHYFPASKLKPVVWAGSLALATTTAYLRYEAGKHYPTDILVGAAVGSTLGWLVPKLHQRKPAPDRVARQVLIVPWSNGVASGFYMQLKLN